MKPKQIEKIIQDLKDYKKRKGYLTWGWESALKVYLSGVYKNENSKTKQA